MWLLAARRIGSLFAVILLLTASAACNQADGQPDESEATSSEKQDDAAGDKPKNKKSGKKNSDEEEEEKEAVPVEVVSLGRGKIESILRFSTHLEAEREVQVLAEATRRVTALLVEEGDDVRAGQALARLQNEEQRTELARVESQLAKARTEYQRQTNLFNQQLISEETYNDATYNLEQLELSLADAKRLLGYTEVRAPISGTVTGRMVNVGDHVTVNQHLFDIVDFDSIVARIYVPEKELVRLGVGQEARMFPQAGSQEARFGTVDRIAPRVDPRSGTVKVTVAIPRSADLLPGMYVTVELITQVHEDALLVPKKALVYDADQIFVFRLRDDQTVERLLIQAALEDRTHIEPAGLLQDGDRIVVAGQASLKEGSEVRVVGEESETVRQADAGEPAESATD